ncbi:putative ent-kaurene oxidase [Diaporthe ampelina]|uniref:Putative ent-kaurene oxidase n=1 Tax=Diaporthe ampelina TaxID=1214573 RepID=A0A0G2FJY7_9PEZI|nr:putative ent-kaurene oxidase [Diaporthe ampelina]
MSPSIRAIFKPRFFESEWAIVLSLFAIYTTSDLMSEIMTQIARKPEVLKPLREEVVAVSSRDGLKNTVLHNLKLMDSVIKECQRLKPIALVSIQLRTIKPMKLANGLPILNGKRVWVDVAYM